MHNSSELKVANLHSTKVIKNKSSQEHVWAMAVVPISGLSAHKLLPCFILTLLSGALPHSHNGPGRQCQT